MLLFLDSFDHYKTNSGSAGNPVGLAQKYDDASNLPLYLGTGRTGNSSAHFIANEFLQKIVRTTADNAKFTVGMAAKRTSTYPASSDGNAVIRFKAGSTTQCTLSYTNTGTFKIWKGDVSGTLLAVTNQTFALTGFQYIEFRVGVHNTTGSFELHIDEVAVALNNGAGGAVSNPTNAASTGTNTGCDTIRINAGMFGADGACDIDDLYILDDASGDKTTFLGDTKVSCVFPNADGHFNSWTTLSGNSHYLMVNDSPANSGGIPDGNTSYVYTNSVGNRDSYGFPAATGINTIHGVQLVASQMATDNTVRYITGFAYSLGANTNYDQTPVLAGTNGYAMSTANPTTNSSNAHSFWILERDPTTNAAWANAAAIAALDFGVKLES